MKKQSQKKTVSRDNILQRARYLLNKSNDALDHLDQLIQQSEKKRLH